MIVRRHFCMLFAGAVIATLAAGVLWYIAVRGIGRPDSVALADARVAAGTLTCMAALLWSLRWVRSRGIVYMIDVLLSWSGRRPPAQTGPLQRLT